MHSNASASVLNAAEMLPGIGMVWLLLCERCLPDVSMSLSVLKKVERLGWWGVCCVVVVEEGGGAGMLCST